MGSIGVAAGMVSAMTKDQRIYQKTNFKKDLDSLFQTSYAYFQNTDKNGNPVRIGSFRYEDNERKLIRSKNEVSPFLINAFFAIEDKDFYKHNGIVPRSLIRASYQQLADSKVTTGGSTLTQQLVKNIILKDSRKDLDRKTKEIILALRLERMYNKDQILVYYMNSVFFGEGAHGRKMYGVQAAAQGLFNKNAKDLELAQAAYIAGMVQRPNDLNPFSENPKNLERGYKRMKLVLTKMLEQKRITKAEYNQAIHFDIKASLAKADQFDYAYQKFPYIMFALENASAEALMKADHLDIQKLSEQGKYRKTLAEYKKKAATGGYHFYTTIDENLYSSINNAATRNLDFHTRNYKGKKSTEQLGATVINNKTGAVLAFVPGTSEFSKNQKDHALDVQRQPGSAIKPLLVYGPALEEGVISPSSQIIDEPLRKSDGSGYYKNSSGNYRGPVDVTTALKHSYNIPAIKTFNALGHEKGFNYLRKLGLNPDKKDGEAAAIGGMTHGFTVEKMSAAFATFANQGYYNEPYIISKITDSNGKVVWEHETNPQKVFSEQTAYEMTNMLKQVVSSGTAAYINSRLPSGYSVAGKTGTTSDEKDLWFVGYTPEITLGVWGGYDYNFRMKSNQYFTKQAWANIFRAAVKNKPDLIPRKTAFKDPGGSLEKVCGFECGKVKAVIAKKQQEEMEKKKQEEAKKLAEQQKNKSLNQQPSNNTSVPEFHFPKIEFPTTDQQPNPNEEQSNGQNEQNEQPNDQNGEMNQEDQYQSDG